MAGVGALHWQVARSGDFTYTTGKTPGYVAGSAWSFTVKDYKNGNAALTSPKVALRANTKYLYKGFYQATVPFDLLVRYYYADGSSQLQYVASYPNEGQWTTASLGFATGQNITAVAFSYHIAGNGTVRFDGTYLEPKQSGLYIAPQPPSLPSRIPNGNLAVATDTLPEGWSSFTSGTNHSSFAYQKEQNDTYLQAVTTDYRDGEAKWQYAPQAVQGSQQLRFAVDYRATAPAEVMAEYVLEDGSRQFETLATVGPTNQWTQRATTLETPAMARSLFVSVVLHRNGTLDTKDYTLSDVTRPGAARFKRPLVSVTFDDGWQSSYTNGARILDQSGYKGTYFLNPSVIDTDKFFTTMQVDDLQRRGHELSAHGYNHLDMTTINPGQIMFQLEGAARYIKQKTNTTAIDYASPYGKSDAEVQFYARNYFPAGWYWSITVSNNRTLGPPTVMLS